MITNLKTTKIVSIVMALVIVLSTMCIAGTVTAGAATERVSLYSSNVYFSKYGASTYEVYIQTKDNAKNQEVYVHYNYLDYMGWQDVQAEYFTTLSDGSKIWKAYFSSYNTRYAIKYVADGRTYWDNNNGKDYDGTQTIGSAPVVSKRLGYQYVGFNGYHVEAVLQNYSYHKEVFVRYTTDGWRTYRDQYMNYSQTNSDGTETWDGYLNVNMGYTALGNFEYAICYRVNGNEYWANNFDSNYNYYYYINH